MKRNESLNFLRRLVPTFRIAAALLAGRALAHEAEPIEFSPVGIPYAWAIELEGGEETEIAGDHVGAWSWDEDGFPATAKGWTHTSSWVKLDLSTPASLTLKLEAAVGVPWPSAEDPTRLAGTNLFPSFTLYRGWDTDAGLTKNPDGTTLDQDHTFNNRGNIAWAEDVTYLDHVDNSTSHTAARTWVLPAGHYTINLGGNSPAVIAEGRQGYHATFTAAPALSVVRGAAVIDFDRAAWEKLASGFGKTPVLTLSGFFDQLAANSLPSSAILTNAQSGYSYLGQTYAVNGAEVVNLQGRTSQPTTFAWVPGKPTQHGGRIGLGGISRFEVFGGIGGNLLFGDYTLQFDPSRLQLGGSGWFLQGNIEPAAPVFDLLNVNVKETSTSLSITGDLAVTFEIANFLFSTPGDTLVDVGNFSFTGYTSEPAPLNIGSVTRKGESLEVRGINGEPGTSVSLTSSTDAGAPASSWKNVGSGTFDAGGICTISVAIDAAISARFFRLVQP